MNKRKYFLLGLIIVLVIGVVIATSFFLGSRNGILGLRRPTPPPPMGATIISLPISKSGITPAPSERTIIGWEAEALSTTRRLGFDTYKISILGFPTNPTLDQVLGYYVDQMKKMGYSGSVLSFKNPEGHWVTSWRDNDAGTGLVVIYIPSLGDAPTYVYTISGAGAHGQQVLPTPDD